MRDYETTSSFNNYLSTTSSNNVKVIHDHIRKTQAKFDDQNTLAHNSPKGAIYI